MSEEFLKSVQEYLKLDDADTVLRSIVSAAIQKCEEETGKAFDESCLYGQAVKMLAAEWYDHRGITTTEQLKELTAPAHIQGILNQIALSSDYAEVKSE
ncbi:MAG: head-tail connector protein [Anaerovoracaceae bacterium]